MKHISTFLALLAIIFMAACSSTSMVGSWSDPAAQEIRTSKVAVFGVTPRMDIRQNVEKQMVLKFKEKGVNITGSLDIFPPDMKDIGVVESELLKQGYKMAIVISLVDSKEDTRYVPGTTSYAPMGYYAPFRGYMGTAYGTYYEPGYYETTSSYFLECNAYTLPEGKLVYSGQTMTVDPSGVDKFSYELSETLVKDMVSRGILPEK